ncbi:MAG TPA: hypothetical protein VJW23_15505 [Propionibacteriaceae bacterium]|nr:hypothetical protein [Propionibacteriaceae bacterium]
MVLSGLFQGPVVLLGISPTTADEARFFRGVVRAAERVGVWPMAILLRLMPLMARSAKTTEVHKQELLEDIKMNTARDAVRVSSEYLDYIAADRDPAAELSASGHPAWVVHAEKGDGGLTDDERATLEAAPTVTLVTIPGAVFLLPDEAPQQIAEVIATAVAQAPNRGPRTQRRGCRGPRVQNFSWAPSDLKGCGWVPRTACPGPGSRGA